MRTLLPLIAFAVAVPCFAQGFQPDGQAFVWRNGKEYIRFDRGQFSAGIDGGRSLGWITFLWHDNWVYETLHGGKADTGPTVQPDGSLLMSGTFSARENSAPMKYTLWLTPSPDGVKARWEFEKSAALPLTSGVWTHLFADKKAFDATNQVWARPSWHTTMASPGEASANAVLVALDGRRSLQLATDGYRSFNTDSSKDSYVFRYNLVPRDFPVGEKASAELTVSFADMPERFGGEIYPMTKPLNIGKATPSSATVGRFEKLELSVDLSATYDNPFDPDDIALDAVFTAPSGRKITVPGFFAVDYKREISDKVEALIPEGNGSWKVRFTPAETGKYTYLLKLKDRTGAITGGVGSFTATASKAPGFVRTSKVDPHYLQFDNGKGYFAIGHNLPIYHTSDQLGDEAMRKMAASGENYNRWWMCSYGFGIEWGGKLGWYRQDAASRIDLVLDVARETGMTYMMCMDTHQDFREGGWQSNPFNKTNGGPCATPADWFTDIAARALYKKRLRYTIARWGYSPNVLCWEFGNEFEGWADTTNALKLPWHREMSDYLRSIDPFGHLITTSFWSNTGPEEFWRLPNIDIVQTHCYTNDDANVAERVRQFSLHQWERFPKPHIFGEFGINSGAGTEKADPKGWSLHNALWAGLTSFCAGGPMPWWHENWIDPLNLYFHFTSIANFSRDLPLGTAKWEPLATSQPQFTDPNHVPETRDVRIFPTSAFAKPEFGEFVIRPDGSIEDDRNPLQLIQGEGHKDLQSPPNFIVDYPKAGQFIMHIDNVSNSGFLRVWVDGVKKAEYDLPCGEKLGEKSVWQEQWKLWETTYNRDIATDIPAGKHRIMVENLGKDWVRVTSYTFTGCKVMDTPNLLVCGMKYQSGAVLWLQNRDSDWKNHGEGGRVAPVDPCRLELQGLPDGKYTLEWWETWKGSRTKTETVQVRDGKLLLSLPAIEADVAMKVRAG